MVELKEESLENNFLIFKNIPVYIEISEDDSFIYQYGNEKIRNNMEADKKIAVNSWQIQYFTDPDYYIQNDENSLEYL